MLTLADIRAAQTRLGDAIYHSPLPYSLSLSRLCGCDIFCKLDHLQMTGSFKERGALNKLLQLSDDQRTAGVIAASAGNHALGLAYHGQRLGVPVTVVMPQWAPLVKVSNCRGFGATVILHGETFDDARAHALQLTDERQLTFVPPFDDPDIMAGGGTVGLEILEDLPDADAVIVPVGGGGLLSGIGTVFKALRPSAKVIGVEPAHAPTLRASLDAGTPTRVATRPTLADGLAVAQIGTHCFDVIRRVLDDLILVDETQIAKAVLRLLELEKTVVEGAGAVPLAAVMNGAVQRLGLQDKKVVLVLCGGNIDVTMIARIIDRGLAADGRLMRLTAHIAERPGSLAKLLSAIADAGGSVKEISHDRHFGPADVAQASVSIVLETRDAAHIAAIRTALTTAGFDIDNPAAVKPA